MQSSQERQPSRNGPAARRTTDRVEDVAAWVLTAAGLFVVILSVLGGLGVHEDVRDRGRAAERDRTEVEAILVDDAPLQYREPGAADWASRTARYTDAAGQERELVLTVTGSSPAGMVVSVWVDRDGNLTAAPFTGTDAVVLGAVAAVGITVVGGLVLVLLWVAVRRWLDRCNDAGWDREWARIEPEWGGRGR